MKRAVYLVLVLLIISCGNDRTAGLSTDSPPEISSSVSGTSVKSVVSVGERARYKEGELLVKFKSGVSPASSLRAHQSTGANFLRKFSLVPRLEHVKLPEGLSVKHAIAQYMNDPAVEYAEPNYIKHASVTPNDPLFSQQWGMTKINTPGAWDITTGSRNVVVAVIDTGIDSTHPDLTINVVPGRNFITGTTNTADDNGHGTHVSGIIGAVGNNGTGIAGMMWSVQLMPLKFLGADGTGTIGDEIAAIDFAVAQGAKIMNASFAGSDFSCFEYEAINQASSVGILVMAAAGNGDCSSANATVGVDIGQLPCYPASFGNPNDPNLTNPSIIAQCKHALPALSNIISVASTDQGDNLAAFSNYGQTSVHVAAPGVNILSTRPINLFPDGYGPDSGTSMSTPFVTGLAGLLYSVYPSFSYPQIRGMIIKYIDLLPSLQNKVSSGGRINAFNAVSALLAPTNLSVSNSPPTQVTLAWTDNATGEDGYKVEKRTGGGSFSQIAALGVNVSSFTDSDLTDGTSFTYRVRAFTSSLPNPAGSTLGEADSGYSNEATVSIPLNPPTGLTATTVADTSVTLVWTNNSQASQGVKIQRQSQGGSFGEIGTVGAGVTTFADTGLGPSTTYSYRVAAFNSSVGDSAFSNTVTVTTSSPTPSPTPSGGGGGGGCSIGSKPNTPTAVTDLAIILIPLFYLLVVRRRR